MRSNRAVRDRLQHVLGSETVDEVIRWNDSNPDSLERHGLDLDPTEALLQDQTFELLAAEERIATHG